MTATRRICNATPDPFISLASDEIESTDSDKAPSDPRADQPRLKAQNKEEPERGNHQVFPEVTGNNARK